MSSYDEQDRTLIEQGRSSIERQRPFQISEEIIAAGVCFVIAGLFFSRTGGRGRWLDWIYPQWLLGFVTFIGAVLLVRGLLGHGKKRSVVPPILRGDGIDVAVFILIAFAFAILLEPVGFWPMAVVMVFGTSMVLSTERNRRTVVVSLVTALAVAVTGYLIFREVFFIPFPEPSWWPN